MDMLVFIYQREEKKMEIDDPNVTLARLIELCEQWENWGVIQGEPIAMLDEITELVLTLDNWMTGRRGFLPDLWS
jgi:hypothetical protein